MLAIVNVNRRAAGWLLYLHVRAGHGAGRVAELALAKPAMSLKRLTAGRDKAIVGVP